MSLVFGQNVDLDSIPAKAYFDTDVEINLEGYEDSNLTWSWVIEKPDGTLFTDPSDDNNTILTFMPNALGFNETGIKISPPSVPGILGVILLYLLFCLS